MCYSFQEARRARLVESGPQIEVLVRGPIVAVDAAVLAAAARIHATVERYIGTALTPLYVKTRVLAALGDGLACAEVCHDALVDLSRKEALKASDDLACGPAIGGASGDVVAGWLVESHADDDGSIEGGVGLGGGAGRWSSRTRPGSGTRRRASRRRWCADSARWASSGRHVDHRDRRCCMKTLRG